MSAIANPLTNYLLPGQNPTGNQVSMGMGTGANNPLLSLINLSSSAAPTSNNPYSAGMPSSMVTPNFPANTGGFPSSGGSVLPGTQPQSGPGGTGGGSIIGGMTPTQFANLYQSLKKTFGPGLGGAISEFLQSGAGYNQDAINNLLASLQPGIQRGEENLMEQFSVSGNRFGSGAEIGLGDYLSQVNLNEGELVSQMYEQAIQNYMNILGSTETNVANTKMHQPSTWDTISGILNLVGGGAGALSAAGVGGGSGTLSSIISGLATL